MAATRSHCERARPRSIHRRRPAGDPWPRSMDRRRPAGAIVDDLEAYRCARDPVCASTPPSERPTSGYGCSRGQPAARVRRATRAARHRRSGQRTDKPMTAAIRRVDVKRSFGRSASPIAAMVVLAALLTRACAAGQNAASATLASTPQDSPSAGGERRRAVSRCIAEAEPDCSRADLDPGEPGRGLAGAGPHRARRRPRPSCRSLLMARNTGIRRATRSPVRSRGSTSTGWDLVTTTPSWPTSRGRRKWIQQNSGSPTGSSSTTTATASLTGGSAWTTSQGPRRSCHTVRGSPTSTPVKRSRRC